MNSSYFKIPLPLSFNFLRKKAGINPLIVNYHVVSDNYIPYVKNLYSYRNVKSFSEDLDFFISNYNPIGLLEFLDYIQNNKKIPENAVLFTIDDGFREVYEIMAPMMLERNLTATLFLTSGFVDNNQFGFDQKKSLVIEKLHHVTDQSLTDRLREQLESNNLFTDNLSYSIMNIPYIHGNILDSISTILDLDFNVTLKQFNPFLTTTQVTELIQSGFTIGGHSIDHPNFTELSIQDQVIQAQKSVDFLTEKFAVTYKVFAFPYWDGGISRAFFEKLSVDASFGTQGLLTDTVISNFQRIGIEKYNHTAERIIKAHYLRKILYHSLHRDTIMRP